MADDKTVPSLDDAEAMAERYRTDTGLTVRIVRESPWEAFVRELGVVLSAVWTRFLYPTISVVVLVFWAMFAWYTAWDLIGFARKSPGMFIAGLLVFFLFPIVCGLVLLARRIWRWYRPARPRGRADPDDYDFSDLGEPPRR